jgi:hypothetical protein
MIEFDPIIELKISVQRALIGEVTENLFAITAGLEDNWITVIAFYKGAVAEEDVERIQEISSEVIADFPEGYMIKESALSLDEHKLQCLDFWALMKAE